MFTPIILETIRYWICDQAIVCVDTSLQRFSFILCILWVLIFKNVDESLQEYQKLYQLVVPFINNYVYIIVPFWTAHNLPSRYQGI